MLLPTALISSKAVPLLRELLGFELSWGKFPSPPLSILLTSLVYRLEEKLKTGDRKLIASH